MKDTNETRSKRLGFVFLVKHTRNYAVYCGKKAVKQRTVFQEKRPQRVINGENTMSMLNIYHFKRHCSGSVNGIHVAAGRTETGMTTKDIKFKFTTIRTNIHGTTIRRVATMNHFFYILDDRVTRMLKINHFLIMVNKNFL